MPTDMTLQLLLTTSGQTEQLGEHIGRNLRGGEVIELISDLGGGKTTLTRGIARGAGSTDKVASPSFTMSREYETPHFTIMHFDLYRLATAGVVGEELREFVSDVHYVTVVEWAAVAEEVLPASRMTITISKTANEDERSCVVRYPAAYKYLLKGYKVE